ncbi:DUF1572 family protein [Peribacillus frigoritolerans]|uniref:DUF1572 family protein n=1 Tax=Peribacillus frigoritolerans TaxID=450367 RepID=UPI0023DAE2E9|nr:DUF1572 family protein [Peribacillus frigoritolerans]MDF1998184.1 DUF1572 family protein [Peribacillus frigoritolerans]
MILETNIKDSIERFKSVKSLGDKTVNQLSERKIHWTHNIESVAVIVKHLSGNMISQGGMTF